jgi:hypothetical protein
MPTHSISIRVDKSTFQTWARSMAVLRTQWQVPVAGVDDVSALPPLPARYRFSGLKLLREVGLAASRPDVLADRARHFAILRSATAIAEGDRFLLVQELARSDAHKKQVLSDEVGSGFALLIARKLLGARRFMDLRVALDDGLVVLDLPRAEQPDYVARTSIPSQLVIIEAKGTQKSLTYSRTQVRRGCEQVANVSAGDPSITIAHRIAVGIALARVMVRLCMSVILDRRILSHSDSRETQTRSSPVHTSPTLPRSWGTRRQTIARADGAPRPPTTRWRPKK